MMAIREEHKCTEGSDEHNIKSQYYLEQHSILNLPLHLVEMMVFRMDSDWATRRGHQMVQQRAVVIQMDLN